MNKIFRRLRSRAGESLIESMAAILIFTMGSIIMLSMVSTAADINATAKQEDESYNNQIRAAEMTDMEHRTDGTVTISINATATDTVAVDIFRYNAESEIQDALYTFYKAPEVVGGVSGD